MIIRIIFLGLLCLGTAAYPPVGERLYVIGLDKEEYYEPVLIEKLDDAERWRAKKKEVLLLRDPLSSEEVNADRIRRGPPPAPAPERVRKESLLNLPKLTINGSIRGPRLPFSPPQLDLVPLEEEDNSDKWPEMQNFILEE